MVLSLYCDEDNVNCPTGQVCDTVIFQCEDCDHLCKTTATPLCDEQCTDVLGVTTVTEDKDIKADSSDVSYLIIITVSLVLICAAAITLIYVLGATVKYTKMYTASNIEHAIDASAVLDSAHDASSYSATKNTAIRWKPIVNKLSGKKSKWKHSSKRSFCTENKTVGDTETVIADSATSDTVKNEKGSQLPYVVSTHVNAVVVHREASMSFMAVDAKQQLNERTIRTQSQETETLLYNHLQGLSQSTHCGLPITNIQSSPAHRLEIF